MSHNLKLSDLQIGQKVTINGLISEYQGIQKIKIKNFGKAEKRVFKTEGINVFKYFEIVDGLKTLKSQNIVLR